MTIRTSTHSPARAARRLAVLVTLLVLVPLVLPGAATAYIKQPPFVVKLTGPGTVRCDRAAQLTARVVDFKTKKPIRHQVVRWSIRQSQSSGDRISDSQTTTDGRGRTTITLSFGPVAGTRTVRAQASVVPATISVRCAGGLPETVAVGPGDATLPGPRLASFTGVSAPLVTDAQLGIVDPGTPAVRLRVARLGMDLAVEAGDGVTVPDTAAAHYPGTAWPGAGSNTFLYAHNRTGLFAELWRVRTGDLVSLDLADGTVATYRVSQIRPVVAWDDLGVLAPTATERLTLQTCLTYDPAAPRMVVIADRVNAPA